jgi:hypothetical protein
MWGENWKSFYCTLRITADFPSASDVKEYLASYTTFCSGEKFAEWNAQAGLKLEKMELRSTATKHSEQRNWLACCRKLA